KHQVKQLFCGTVLSLVHLTGMNGVVVFSTTKSNTQNPILKGATMNSFLPTPSCLKYANVLNLSARTLVFLLAAFLAVCSLENAKVQSAYAHHTLVSDVAGLADVTHTNLVNALALTLRPT